MTSNQRGPESEQKAKVASEQSSDVVANEITLKSAEEHVQQTPLYDSFDHSLLREPAKLPEGVESNLFYFNGRIIDSEVLDQQIQLERQIQKVSLQVEELQILKHNVQKALKESEAQKKGRQLAQQFIDQIYESIDLKVKTGSEEDTRKFFIPAQFWQVRQKALEITDIFLERQAGKNKKIIQKLKQQKQKQKKKGFQLKKKSQSIKKEMKESQKSLRNSKLEEIEQYIEMIKRKIEKMKLRKEPDQ